MDSFEWRGVRLERKVGPLLQADIGGVSIYLFPPGDGNQYEAIIYGCRRGSALHVDPVAALDDALREVMRLEKLYRDKAVSEIVELERRFAILDGLARNP